MSSNHKYPKTTVKKPTILTKNLKYLSDQALFDILYSNEYSQVTQKQVALTLRSRGVYG